MYFYQKKDYLCRWFSKPTKNIWKYLMKCIQNNFFHSFAFFDTQNLFMSDILLNIQPRRSIQIYFQKNNRDNNLFYNSLRHIIRLMCSEAIFLPRRDATTRQK
jgi:hypothetical protein